MKKLITFEAHLNKRYGRKGTPNREKFEGESLAFRLGEMLKEERKKANLTQEQLAKKPEQKKLHLQNRIREKRYSTFHFQQNN